MNKITTFYSHVLLLSTLSTLVGCSYNQKNGMMRDASGKQAESVYVLYDERMYKFKSQGSVLEKLIDWEDQIDKSETFLKEKAFNTNYTNKLVDSHKDFLKEYSSNANLVCAEDLPKILFDKIKEAGSIRNEIISKLEEIDFNSKDYAQSRLSIASQSSAETAPNAKRKLAYLPHKHRKGEGRFLRKKINQEIDNRIMKQVKLTQESNFADLSSKLDEAINRSKDYWCTVLLGFIRYGLLTSLSQGKIDYDQSKRRYSNLENHINSFAKESFVEAYDEYSRSFLGTYSSNIGTANIAYNPQDIINKLEALRLNPLKSSYDKLSERVTKVTDDFDAELKQKVKNSLDILYNMLRSYALLNVIEDILIMPLYVNAPKNHDSHELILRIGTASKLYASMYKLLLTKASVEIAEKSDISSSLNQMNDAITKLKQLGTPYHINKR